MKTLVLLVLAPLLLFIAILIVLRSGAPATPPNGSNVAMIDGKQVIRIDAKGGYAPRESVASANTPTAINVRTNGTFDCSTALVLPRLGIKKSLPPSGDTMIDIPPQPAGTTLQGLCAMGMYSFSVKFQ